MKPAIVIITERQLFPVDRGMRARIVTLVRSLRHLGFRVVLVTAEISGVRTELRTRWLVDALVTVDARIFPGGSPTAYDSSPFEPAVTAAVKRHSPVAVIAEYIWMAPCLRAVHTDALRMIDTHDLMHARRGFADRVAGEWVTCTQEEEARLLEKGDVVIAIQARERREFQKLVPDKRVICVPHYVPVSRARRSPDRRLVAVVGSANPCNVEGMNWFVSVAWPLVRRLVPDAELRVYGALAEHVPIGNGVTAVGHKSDLGAAYRCASVVINPTRFGTGLKVKTVEALAYGKALVTTSCGADGLQSGSADAFVIADDAEKFGLALAHLLLDQPARAQLESSARRFASAQFSLERVYSELLDAITVGRASTDLGTTIQAIG